MGTKIIAIKSKKLGTHSVLIDEEDYLTLPHSSIWLTHNGKKGKSRIVYAMIHLWQRKCERLHRYVLKIKSRHHIVDHINRNTLDCRKLNLRVITKYENSLNRSKVHRKCTSKYVGVHFSKSKNKFIAKCKIGNKRTYLGSFNTDIEAAKAYNEFIIVNKLDHLKYLNKL